MPLVRINLQAGRTPDAKGAIADAVQDALVSVIGIPMEDRFAMVHEYPGADFTHSKGFFGCLYTNQLLMIEITFIEGRSDQMKKLLLQDIHDRLVATGQVGGDDIFVCIHEVAPANISFGKGLAQRTL